MAEALRQQAVEGVAEGVAEHEEVPVGAGAGGLDAQVVHVPDGSDVLKDQVIGEVPLVLQLIGGGVQHDVQVPLVVFGVGALPLEHVPGKPQVREEHVVGQGRSLVGPVGVPPVVEHLRLLGEGAVQVAVGDAVLPEGLRHLGEGGDLPPLQPAGPVLGVEGQLVGGHGKQEGPAFALHILLGQLQRPGDGPHLAVRQGVGAGVVLQRLRVKEPPVLAQGHLLLGGGVEQPGLPGGVRGDELLPEGEAVGEIVPGVGDELQIPAAVGVFQLGLGGEHLVGRGLALAHHQHAQAGHHAGAEEQEHEQGFQFPFHSVPAFPQNLK